MNVLSRQEAITKLAEHQVPKLALKDREEILLSWWCIDEEDPEYWRLPTTLQHELKTLEQPEDAASSYYDLLLTGALVAQYRGVLNAYIEREWFSTIGTSVRVEGQVEHLQACPCCAYRTLDQPYDICPVCFWEWDGTRNASDYSSANGMHLSEGQENFQRFGACSKDAQNSVDPNGKEKYIRA